MRIGVVIPQGWTGEFGDVRQGEAWERLLSVARDADRLGFESLWLYDHFHTTPEPRPTTTFEAFTALAGIAMITRRARLGQLVSCAGYRNPALVAKMVATMDVMSAGRMELGLGAGWKEEEWRAYGYDFPPIAERMSRLEDALRIARAMFYRPDGATYEGPAARIVGAISYPEPFRPEGIPIVVGGNGRRRTWPLAVRFADELNLDAMPPHEVPEAMDAISRLCASVGRDPATLRVSVHVWWEQWSQGEPGALIQAYRATGIHRLITLVRESAWDDGALEAFRDAVVRAGAEVGRVETTSTAEAVTIQR